MEWASDVDGDDLGFRVEPSLYLKINGTNLMIDFLGTYRGTEYNATIFADDGTTEVSRLLHFTIEGALPPPEINVNSVEIEPTTNGWYINIYADDGQTIYVMVFDSEGEFQTFQANYEIERYSVFIPDSMAEKGNEIIITNEPGGDEILPQFTTPLPALKKENETGDYTVYIILAILLLIILIAVLFLITRRKKDDYYEE